jgi:hypothetical protein
MNANEIHRIKKEYFETLHSNKFKNLVEMDKFLGAFDQPKLKQAYANHLNESIACIETKVPIANVLPGKFYQT